MSQISDLQRADSQQGSVKRVKLVITLTGSHVAVIPHVESVQDALMTQLNVNANPYCDHHKGSEPALQT